MDSSSHHERELQGDLSSSPPPADRHRLLTPADLTHRREFRDYCLQHAEPWHRDCLTRLFGIWDQANARYFQDQLVPPYLMLSEPGHSRSYGDCSAHTGFGGKCQIRIRPSLLTGTHPHIRGGEAYAEGRFLFVADVLLHEAIHQFHFEVTGKTEDSYRGHGPAFRDVCNRIGSELGLRPVRTAKARGQDRDRPSCAQWPHCVRPPHYYLGAYATPVKGKQGRVAENAALVRLVATARAYRNHKCVETLVALCQAAEGIT